jgi:hypothetical protein
MIIQRTALCRETITTATTAIVVTYIYICIYKVHSRRTLLLFNGSKYIHRWPCTTVHVLYDLVPLACADDPLPDPTRHLLRISVKQCGLLLYNSTVTYYFKRYTPDVRYIFICCLYVSPGIGNFYRPNVQRPFKTWPDRVIGVI